MLNIHLPEFGNVKVSDLNTSEAELPVLCGHKLFVNGEVVDSISDDEIPDFSVLVISESNTIQKKTSSTRSLSSNVMLGNNYEYVSPVFNPNYNKHNSISCTRSGGQEAPSDKYTYGIQPSSDLDPELIQAYNVSKSSKRGTRCAMYYGLNNLNDTAMTLRSDVKDCIYKIRVSFSARADFEDVATNRELHPFFKKDTTSMKQPITRDKAISALITGRAYCFLFTFTSGNEAQGNVTTQSIKVYARPDQLFNLDVNESKRHHTAFRHTKYTYKINQNNIDSKWFYPLENKQFPVLDRWNLLKDPITKSVVVYLINPDEGMVTTTSESYTLKYSSDVNLGLDAKVELSKILNLGINGKFDTSNSFEKTVTKTYSITAQNLRLGDFQMDYFDDYPISTIYSDGRVVPMILGTGPITMSILPLSIDYLIEKGINENN